MINFTSLKFTFVTTVLLLFSALFLTPLSAQTPAFIGMTQLGGTGLEGTIFAFDPDTDADYVLWNFGNDTSDGRSPVGSLTYNTTTGLFYGMTYEGGKQNDGTIISINPVNNAENALWSFGLGTDGANPQGNLVADPNNGLYYGMTELGGNSNKNSGAIISFNPQTDSESVVWSFADTLDGQWPLGSLVYDANTGMFYGLTSGGGADTAGAIISFNPNTGADSLLWSFGVDSADGAVPLGSLVFNPNNGLYYGTTFTGGTHKMGAIISFNPATNTEHLVWSFGLGSDGAMPEGDMIFDATSGLFFGMTTAGGTNYNSGVIFSFNPTTNKDSVRWNFGSGNDGRNPGSGALVYYPDDGLYYGMTPYGGRNEGVIFSFNPQTNAENVVWTFRGGNDASAPFGSLVLYPPGVSVGIRTVSNPSSSIHIFPNPNNGRLNITGLSAGQVVELYNTLGQQVSNFTADNTFQTLDISAQANGFYIIKVFNMDGTPADVKKVLKTN